MNIKEYVKSFNKTFSSVKEEFNTEFNTEIEKEKSWSSNIEDKLSLFEDKNTEKIILQVITKLKTNNNFTEADNNSLSLFTSKINKIIKITNRLNNFKEGTVINDNKGILNLYWLFNQIKNTKKFDDLNLDLNSNLNPFLPHFFSVVKQCQNPNLYPIYYKYCRNIIKEVFDLDNNYDSICKFYREIPENNRHINFAAYFAVIGSKIIENLENKGIDITKTKVHKFLLNNVTTLSNQKDFINKKISKTNNTQKYWLYAPGENAIMWEEFYNDGVVALGWDSLGDLNGFKSKKEIADKLRSIDNSTGSKKNDANANYEFCHTMSVGDIVITKKGVKNLIGFGIVSSEYKYDESKDTYKHYRKIEWKKKGLWNTSFSLVLKTLTDITKYPTEDPNYNKYSEKLMAIMNGEIKNNKENYTKWLNSKVETENTVKKYIKSIDFLNEIIEYNIFETTNIEKLDLLYADLLKNQTDENGKYYSEERKYLGSKGFYSASIKNYKLFLKDRKTVKNNNNFSKPLNTILYGPPGTGKTYNTILKSAEIISQREITDYNEAKEIFNNNLHDRIEFITFHQNYSYEDFIQGLRPDTEGDSALTFNKKDGIFKRIADRALKNLEQSEKNEEEISKEANFEIALEIFSDKILDKEEQYQLNDTTFIYEVEEDSYRYTGNNWKDQIGFKMKFSDLKEFYLNDIQNRKEIKILKNISGTAKQHATYYLLAYNEILKYLPKQIQIKSKIPKQNYVIIIDEINRANISRVFGELITLIEPDKRSHGDLPLEAVLPSGDTFKVPSNLYIIGTMNTADKSIALLDIALRRRFEFEAMFPLYKIKGHKIYDVEILEKINAKIIETKGHDFQIGHSYFMGKDNKDLTQRMNKKVIPLLLEYYMNDEEEVKKILTSAGLKIKNKSWPLRIEK